MQIDYEDKLEIMEWRSEWYGDCLPLHCLDNMTHKNLEKLFKRVKLEINEEWLERDFIDEIDIKINKRAGIDFEY